MNPEILRTIAILGRPLTNQVEFSLRLARSADMYVRVAGIAALLDLGALPGELWQVAVAESRHGVVATKAFRFFSANLEYELAERVVSTFAPFETPVLAAGMRAALKLDSPRLVEAAARQFLDDGRVERLIEAAEHAEAASGWREGVVWLARAMVLQPIVAAGPYPLLRLLETANQFAMIEDVLAILAKGEVFADARSIFSGVLLLHRKDAKGALQSVSKLRLADLKSAPTLQARVCQIRALANEGLGQHREALRWYQEFKRQSAPQGIDKRAYLASVERLARVDCPALSEDLHCNHVMMLGFPRSGTTLLENALAAHPAIETFEEIPSLTRTILRIEQIVEERIAGEEARREAFELARRRYYDEIERWKAKPGASVFIDKLPIRSAWIRTMEKLFPEKRYIFSIRHPYDVVLSCFKQSFTPNAAMENFRTLEHACEFYDRVMSIWFSVFPAEHERVLYVRYDQLVADFENELKHALAFLGVAWSDDVLRFAEMSEARRVATPSYGMVRGGLGIGVQSSWRNYRFVFDTQYGAKLHKWVDRFGYER